MRNQDRSGFLEIFSCRSLPLGVNANGGKEMIAEFAALPIQSHDQKVPGCSHKPW